MKPDVLINETKLAILSNHWLNNFKHRVAEKTALYRNLDVDEWDILSHLIMYIRLK